MEHDTRENIRWSVANEMFRIFCFLVYYVALMLLGVAIIVGAFYLTYWLAVLGMIFGIFFTILSIIGLWAFAIMFAIYLVKPLFSFSKNENASRVEVDESDCPELFAMIREVAESTQCPMPKHVFLTPDVNACVFYNTSFWSIFFPVRKNLEIGLGLLDGTSVDEVKAIIAHEFGHFSQNSMKVGSTVYVTNTVLHNLVFGRDKWDVWVEYISSPSLSIIKYFGRFTRFLSDCVRSVTAHVYKYVQKGYLKLSRYMEYDADDIASQYIGGQVFISALCKVEVLSENDNLYQQLVKSLTQEKKIVSNYFACKRVAYQYLSGTHTARLSYDESLTEPKRRYYYVPSKIRMENVWASHPSLEDRIANVKGHGSMKSTTAAKPAWTLIPDKVARQVSANFISLIESGEEEKLTHISDSEFEQWVQTEIKENFIDRRLVPFFAGHIYEFDLDRADSNTPATSPFTVVNAIKISKLATGTNDYSLFLKIKNKEVDADDVEYDGVIYNRKHLPIDDLKAKLDALYKEVLKIYSDIYAYVKSRTENGDVFKTSFRILFYAQWLDREVMPRLVAHRNAFVEAWNKTISVADEDDYAWKVSMSEQYEGAVKDILSKMSLNVAAGIEIVKPYTEYLHEYMNKKHIVQETLDEVDNPLNCVYNMKKILYNAALRDICETSKNVLDK